MQCRRTVLSGNWYHCKGAESVTKDGRTGNPGFGKGWSAQKRAAVERKWRQKQPFIHFDRVQLKEKRHQGGHLSFWWHKGYGIVAYHAKKTLENYHRQKKKYFRILFFCMGMPQHFADCSQDYFFISGS